MKKKKKEILISFVKLDSTVNHLAPQIKILKIEKHAIRDNWFISDCMFYFI